MATQDALSRRVAQPGETIALAGGEPEHLHVLAHGSAAIELPSRRGRPTRLAVARAGDAFGEAHVLDGRRYDASLVALTEVAYYRIPRKKLVRWLRTLPELEARLRRRWDLRLTMLEWSDRQLTTLDPDTLLRAGVERRCKRGEIIYAPGDPARHVYLVVEGVVELSAPGRSRRQGSRVEAGAVFGEVEGLRRRARSTGAAATALLLELDLGAGRACRSIRRRGPAARPKGADAGAPGKTRGARRAPAPMSGVLEVYRCARSRADEPTVGTVSSAGSGARSP
jgi:CRP-like cAMP-binding protein